jgi:hypothetical protein
MSSSGRPTATITPQVVEKKIRVLTLDRYDNVKLIQVLYAEIQKLINDITNFINRPGTDKGLALELQRQRTRLLFEELRCAQFFDAQQVLLSTLNQSAQQTERTFSAHYKICVELTGPFPIFSSCTRRVLAEWRFHDTL